MTADLQHGGHDSGEDSGRSVPNLDSARNLMDLLLMRDTPEERARFAACHKVNGVWKELTWADQILRIRRIAAGLSKLGVRRGDRVAIFADTRIEWILSALAIFAVGASVVPVYGSDTPAEIAYILENSSAVAMIIDHDAPDTRHKMPGRLARVREVWPKLPELKSVILMDPPADASGVSLLADLELEGAKSMDASEEFSSLIERSARETSPDDIAFLLYTSGTTGTPKGVMLTHANWTSQARDVSRIGLVTPEERILLFLPLAHAFALIALAAHLSMGLGIAYAESIDKAIANAGETSTNLMICVPRVLEKAYNKVVSDGSTQPGIKGQLFRWAMLQFEEYANDVIAGREHKSLQWTMAKKLVFSQVQNKIRARFGSMKKFVSGGAPLSKKIAIFFDLCGFSICEGYGLTETCAPTHCNLPIPGKLKLGTVGLAWPGVLVRTAEDGEILLKGPQIMKGYYKMPEATAAAIDPDGWFHTGDIGEVDTDGFMTITDRKKDLLKTSGGKYIAPQELESGLKTEPLIGDLLIVGDRRKFVSALITLAPDSLHDFAAKESIPDGTFAEQSQSSEVRKRIEKAIKALNDKLPSYATIKKFAILDHVWTQENGIITPTMKVKRKEVLKRYQDIIDGFYDGEHFE